MGSSGNTCTTWRISVQKIDRACTQLSLYNVVAYFWFDFINKYCVLKNSIKLGQFFRLCIPNLMFIG
jgi:hypothetical protein